MRSDAGNCEFPAVSQRVQLKVDEADIQAQRLSSRYGDVVLGIRIESRCGDRQFVDAGRQLANRVSALFRTGRLEEHLGGRVGGLNGRVRDHLTIQVHESAGDAAGATGLGEGRLRERHSDHEEHYP